MYTFLAISLVCLLLLKLLRVYLSAQERFDQSQSYRKSQHRSAYKPQRILDDHYRKAASKNEVPRETSPARPAPPQRPTSWSEELLTALEWKRFEELCVAYLHERGLRAKPTRIGADGGVDFNVFEHNGGKRVAIAQCKAWKSYKVGVKSVRELLGVMAAERVPHGIFLTTSRFTQEALAFGHGKNLQLIDGKEFVTLIKTMSEELQGRLLAMATAGDFTTPTCPNCNVKMVLRETRNGKNAGQKFWGCPNYPKCKHTFMISKNHA